MGVGIGTVTDTMAVYSPQSPVAGQARTRWRYLACASSSYAFERSLPSWTLLQFPPLTLRTSS